MKTIKIALISLIIIACNTQQEDENLETIDSVSVQELQIDSMQEAFIATIDQIDRGLEFIRNQEGLIILGPNSNVDPQLNTKDRILRNIQMINGLLEQNKERIEDLEKMLKSKSAENNKMARILKDRSDEYASLYKDIEELKIQLKNRDMNIEDLNQRLSENQLRSELLEGMVLDLDARLYRAFFVIGTTKELKNQKIIERNGGLLGIGSTKSLYSDFDPDYFNVIDARKMKQIPVYSKKANLLTSHPKDSYSFDTEEGIVTNLTITNPDEFWKASKYLVIEVTI